MEHKITFKEYNEALSENKLLGLKCNQCSAITAPPKLVCGECSSTDMDVVELSGKGEIKTFTTVFVAPEGRENKCPYTIVLVGLEEGPWIMGNLTGIEPEKVTMDIIGKKVKMSQVEFLGDKYSAGEGANLLFSLAA